MLDSLVAFSIRRRAVVTVVSALLLLLALVLALPRLPIDAVPDVTNVQVVVLTDSPGLSAEEVERFVTFPVETGLNGLPGLTELRSVTRSGLSAVTIVFDERTDLWFARQLVAERLRDIESDIPDAFGHPQLGPVSTGLGEIYQFVLESDRHTPMELRNLLAWEITPKLRGVRGVIEVNAMGGAAQEYQVVLDPRRLASHRLTLGQVLDALEHNNASVGGGWVERGPEQLVIRGEGQLRTVEEIGQVVVAADADGTPVQVSRLGEVRVGAALAQGVVTRDGHGEAVTGIVMMLIGQNSRGVVHDVHAKIEELRPTLPEGVRIETVYDRASFIDRTLKTVGTNLVEGALLVALVLLVFLGSWRASVVVTLGIPFSMAIAVVGMLLLDVTGSLMSLGAIDFGLLVDGPIVMVEAAIARLAADASVHVTPQEKIGEAMRRVTRPVVFSVAIVLLVYLPLLTLEGVEGKMFRPMAATMALALFGSVVFSLVTFPAMATLLLKAPKHHGGGRFARLERLYERAVRACVARRQALIAGAVVLALATLPVAGTLGADFVPRIDEGDLVVGIRRVPSIGIAEARRLDLEVEKVLRRFPEVVTTIALTGRAEVATDVVGVDNTDVLVRLRPHAEWRTAHDVDALGDAMKTAIEREVPSSFISVSQPIEDRTNELISGSRADVAVVVYGDDLLVLTALSERVVGVLRAVPGAGDVRRERALGQPTLRVRPDRARLARYGIPVDAVLAAVESSRIGRRVGVVFEGNRRYDLRVRLPPGQDDAQSFAALPVGAVDGQLVPLGQLATLVEEDGPAQISRLGLQRRLRVEVNVRGRDLVSFVHDAQAAVGAEVDVPDGYRLEWGGQFANFQRASARLAVVVPMALAIIFTMLFFAFGSARYAAAVFSGVPFALLGGVVSLALRGLPFSIPAAVGFIALCGIAVLNGVVMASEIRRRIEFGASVEEALVAGAVAVLRATLLTAAVAGLGFLPMAMSTSAGSEVQRPLATVVIGGLVSSTALGLFLLPALLGVFLRRERASAASLAPAPAVAGGAAP